jgi:hypothetical protein
VTNSESTLIALNDVLEDRADEFENWLKTIVVPVVTERRPQLASRWRVLRADKAEDGVVVFAFVFEGSPEDAELDPVLEEALGAEGAERELATFASLLKAEQRFWAFTEVPIGG